MSAASIFYDPPVVARRVYAGEVRVIDDIKFWNKTTKVVHSRIYSDDNNLNVEVKDTDKELNFFTNQITFHDADGTQLGYIDSEGTIHGLSVDGHATNVDVTDLEDDLTDNASRIHTLETDLTDNASRVTTLETDLTDNAFRISTLETDLTSNASRVDVLETDLTSNASRVDVLETDLTDNALRVSTLETDLTDNASRIGTLETDLTDNALRVSTLETDLTDNALRVSTLETDLTDNASRVTTLETDLTDNTSRIQLLESNISYDRTVTVEGVEQTVNGNVYTLSVVVNDNVSRIDVLETDLTSNASRVTSLETDVTSNTTRLELLESNISYDRTVTVDGVEETVNGNVHTLSVVVDDHESRIADIEDDYVTSSQLTAATAASAVASTGTSGLISTASTFFTNATGSSKTVSDWFEELGDTYDVDEDFTLQNLVNKPSDWTTYPPTGGGDTTLKSYTEQKSAYEATQKVNAFKNGNSGYVKLRDASENADGDRTGVQYVDFLRTTASESFGANECADWRITTDSSCGLNIYRKNTDPNLGSVYNGNVIEFDADGDVNVNKQGGLSVAGNEVATKSYTDSTFAGISLESSVSQLSTSVSTNTSDITSNASRIATLENAGYITSSALSPYATTSSVNTGLSAKVDTTTLTSDYTTTSGLNTLLNGKVDTSTLTSDYTTTSGLNTLLNGKVDTTTLTSDYTTTSGLNTLLAGKVDTSTLTNDYTSSTALATLLAAKQNTGNYLTGVQVGTVSTGTPAAVTATTSGSTTTLDFTFPSGGSSSFSASGNDIYYSGGNVGIGTSSPGEKLQIMGDSIAISSDPSNNDYGQLSLTSASNYTGGSKPTQLKIGIDHTIGSFGTGFIQGVVDYTHSGINLALCPKSGNVGIGTSSPSEKLDVNGALHLRSDITRSGHSTGYFVGSYNNVGGNSTKTNPIYTIGSNYKPSDTSLGNMYGIGYSHGNFTGYLTSGWGLYVAADGDVRIGLNASHGHIKNSGHIYCGNTIYLSGSTSHGLRGVTGQYGSVQTTGNGANNWRGYSINGQWVFMSYYLGDQGGIYNDIDNKWAFYFIRNGESRMYYNGGVRISAKNHNELTGNGTRIYGTEATINYTNAQSDWWTNGGSIQADPPNLNFSLYVNHYVRATGYVATSDRRIKKDFLELDDSVALEKLRLLRPTSYRYKDRSRNTTDRVIGFVAQEVAEVLPDAVSTAPNIIPSIQTEASVTKIGEAKFEFTLLQPHIVSVGDTLVLKTPTEVHMECKVETVTDDTTFTGKITSSQVLPDDATRVWVTGEMVDDFHHLDKNAIFTVATSALQEVDRRQVAHDERIAALEARNLELETQLQNVLDRLQALETVGG